jgi:hypothetical protein
MLVRQPTGESAGKGEKRKEKEKSNKPCKDEEAARRNERGRGLAVRLLPNLE